METCFNYAYERNHNDNVAFFSSDEVRWINKIRKLQEKRPDEITILAEPEDNDGVIYCRLPQSWLQINVPRQMNMTEEEKNAIRDKLLNAKRQKKK